MHDIIYLMKFYSSTKTISVGTNAKPVFETLDKIRPNDVSFSLMVAIAAAEYIKNHNDFNSCIDSFTSKGVDTSLPLFYADIQKWREKIKKLNSKEFKRLQLRLSQISTIIRKEVDLRI
tara:strand:- start:561 stop:917 length:357 start_codon:yes stop_codon:yes gene_type:complete